MCTMTWWRDLDQYGVYFNRDELKTRPRATPPQIEGGILAPTDPVGGGSWLAVNQHGLIVGLLNHWQCTFKGSRSRGKLVMDLASCQSAQAVEEHLTKMDLTAYSSFTILAMDSNGISRWDWQEQRLQESEAVAPVSSSSYQPEEVLPARKKVYAELVGQMAKSSPKLLEAYHEAEGEALGIRMCRPDAQTWSRSAIRVEPSQIHWEYLEEFENLSLPSKRWASTLSRKLPST